MKIAIPDLISNSYFPAAAAVELGMFKDEGLYMELELIFPVNRTLEVLRDGEIEFVGGSAHSIPHAFPEWSGGKLLASLAQGMYWFLILKPELGAKQGDIEAVAELTVKCLKASVPAEVPGIVFLSGGQSETEATEHLNAMNEMGPHPWALSFSYGRALQQSALHAWNGNNANLESTYAVFYHRAEMNSKACHGEYSPSLEI